jgi:hypothetical protein
MHKKRLRPDAGEEIAAETPEPFFAWHRSQRPCRSSSVAGDPVVLDLNRSAQTELRCQKRLEE